MAVLSILTFVLAGYGVAFGYAAAQPEIAAQHQVLADWLAGHGLRYALGGAAANVVTADSGARTVVAAVTVSQGRVRRCGQLRAAGRRVPIRRLHRRQLECEPAH